MEKDERTKLKKRIKTYENLGALEFQKVVFEVERIKFKVLKKLFPNCLKYYDKYCDFTRKRAIKKATSEEEIKTINRNTAIYKLEARREFNSEKNRNYHISSTSPTDIYTYLNWNKSIHVKGMITDTVMIAATTLGLTLGFPVALLVAAIAIELVSLGINFQCVNIQNYNICRYKLIEDRLKERQQREEEKEIEDHNDIAKIVHDKLSENEKLPSMVEIIDDLKDPEQCEKLKRILLREYQKRETEKEKMISLGGNK